MDTKDPYPGSSTMRSVSTGVSKNKNSQPDRGRRTRVRSTPTSDI